MKSLFVICGLIIIFSSCYNDKANQLYVTPVTTCDTSSITFSGKVDSIINTSCAINSSCHGQNAAIGIDFSTYTGVYNQAITVGDLMNAIQHSSSLSPIQWMPQNAPKLSECEIQQIGVWVNHGALNN